MCGEQGRWVSCGCREQGSPPRVRGTAFDIVLASLRSRITPACAGNSQSVEDMIAALEDHPRVCGEQFVFSFELVCGRGSPPRVRGTDVCGHVRPLARRITPACAGNRAASTDAEYPYTDHPRVCGEQPPPAPAASQGAGSPPRVRGTAQKARAYTSLPRITPACAGNSSGPCPGAGGTPDHPRVCGEQCSRSCKNRRASGSPPRVRGTGKAGYYSSSSHRITPACAGNRGRLHKAG